MFREFVVILWLILLAKGPTSIINHNFAIRKQLFVCYLSSWKNAFKFEIIKPANNIYRSNAHSTAILFILPGKISPFCKYHCVHPCKMWLNPQVVDFFLLKSWVPMATMSMSSTLVICVLCYHLQSLKKIVHFQIDVDVNSYIISFESLT